MRTAIITAALSLPVLLTACGGSAPARHHPPAAVVRHRHAVNVCYGLARAVRDGNFTAASRAAGGQYAYWFSEMQDAIAGTIRPDGSPVPGFLPPGMFTALSDVVAPPGAPGLGDPSAAAIRRLQADCDAAGITAAVWPPAGQG